MASMVESLLVLDMALALSSVPVLASAFVADSGGRGECVGEYGWAGVDAEVCAAAHV